MPSSRLSRAIGRSPCVTTTSTEVWLSAAVENVSRLLGRDGRVARDHRRHHAAERLDAERQRRDVEEQDVLDVAREHAGLHRRAERHDLVGVDALVRLLAEEVLDLLLDHRDARRAADQHDLGDLRRLLAGVGERLLGRLDRRARPGRPIICSSLARESLICRCLGPLASAVRNGRLISVSCTDRQLDLGLLRRLLEALEDHLVLARRRCPGPS